jgi:hypothetical protein
MHAFNNHNPSLPIQPRHDDVPHSLCHHTHRVTKTPKVSRHCRHESTGKPSYASSLPKAADLPGCSTITLLYAHNWTEEFRHSGRHRQADHLKRIRTYGWRQNKARTRSTKAKRVGTVGITSEPVPFASKSQAVLVLCFCSRVPWRQCQYLSRWRNARARITEQARGLRRIQNGCYQRDFRGIWNYTGSQLWLRSLDRSARG